MSLFSSLSPRRRGIGRVLRLAALLLLAGRASATTCAAGSYSYNSGACAACPSGASFVAATGLCAPAAAPSDTAFYLSGSQAEGVAAFPGAPAVSYATGVFGAANGALSFASGASYLSMTPAAGSALLAALPTGNSAFTASTWIKCMTASTMTVMTWGAPGAPWPRAVTTLGAGTARASGTLSTLASGFSYPAAVAVDAAGNAFVLDAYSAVKKISPAGTVITLNSGFSYPYGVAIDAAGNVIVSEYGTGQIKKISPDGNVITLASSGFNGNWGIAVDAAGNLFVADMFNSAVKKISPDGTVSTIGSGFSSPRGVAVDALGNLYVTDTGNKDVKKIWLDGTITMLRSGFSSPFAVAVDAAGSVYVSDNGIGAVMKISPDGTVSTFSSVFSNPIGIAVDGAGNVFVADTGSGAIKIITQAAVQAFCDSTWHHIAVTHGDGAFSATKTYIDGALTATSSQTFAIPSDGSASLAVNWNGVTGISTGTVSDVRLYSRALSASEVLALVMPPLAHANTVFWPPRFTLGASAYALSCAAGASGTAGHLSKSSADNSWSWLPAPPACTPCAAGSWSAPGATACTLCSPGTYSTAGASSCLPCPAGTYGSSAGLASSACTGPCASAAACPLGTAYPPPITGLSCASSAARAVPSSLGVLLWPAANPSNPQHVDLVIAPLATCQRLGGTCSTLASNTVMGADGVTRYIVGTAAALNIEAAEQLECAAVYPSPSASPSAPATASASAAASFSPSGSNSASASATATATSTSSSLPSLTISSPTVLTPSQQLTGYGSITVSAAVSFSGIVMLSASTITITATGSLIGDGGGSSSGQGQGWSSSVPACFSEVWNGLGGRHAACGGLRQTSNWDNAAAGVPCDYGTQYGNANAPMDLGTGGSTCGNSGGSGGAAIFLQATSIVINGVVSVAGGAGSNSPGSCCLYQAGGGGSGGSIRIVAASLQASSGQLIANGGPGGRPYAGGWAAGGSGGRISVSATSWAMGSTSLTVSALGGTSTSSGGAVHDFAGEGTVALQAGGSSSAFVLAPAAPACATITSTSTAAGRTWSVGGTC